jgi:uncharacterized membrane protein YpjA
MKFSGILDNRKMLIFLILVNICGFFAGIYYYYIQLSMTPAYFWIFVIDCPLYTLLMAVVLVMKLKEKRSDVLNFLTSAGLIKYGLWTGIVVFLYRDLFFAVNPVIYSLLFPLHIGMILEGIILIPHFKTSVNFFLPVLGWFLLNDYMDYFIGTVPIIPGTYIEFLTWKSFATSIVITAAIFAITNKKQLTRT